jgi:tetratricopeptide (TPR) repeat protein
MTAGAYQNLAEVYNEAGDYVSARHYYEKALAIRLLQLDEQHPEIAISYHNLAVFLYERNELHKAMEYCQKSLEIRLSRFGRKHLDTAASWDLLASLLLEYHDAESALALYQKVLKVRHNGGFLHRTFRRFPVEYRAEIQHHAGEDCGTQWAYRTLCAAARHDAAYSSAYPQLWVY